MRGCVRGTLGHACNMLCIYSSMSRAILIPRRIFPGSYHLCGPAAQTALEQITISERTRSEHARTAYVQYSCLPVSCESLRSPHTSWLKLIHPLVLATQAYGSRQVAVFALCFAVTLLAYVDRVGFSIAYTKLAAAAQIPQVPVSSERWLGAVLLIIHKQWHSPNKVFRS